MSTTALATMTSLLEEYDAQAGNANAQNITAHRVVQHVKTTRAEAASSGPVMRPMGSNKLYPFQCMTCGQTFPPGQRNVWVGDGPERNVYQCGKCHG